MNMLHAAIQEKRAFSLAEYAQIIEAYKPLIRDFAEVERKDPAEFCLIRHDMEFSLSRALMLAELDAQLGIRSTFFVQVKNPAYNPLAPLNAKIVRQLQALGHYVGLHFYVTDIAEGNIREIVRQLKFQTPILEEALGQKVDRFSYHRPPVWTLKINLRSETDMINAYDPKFFEITSGCDPQHIKYMADSQHAWKYGHPLTARGTYKKFQILMHPDEWSVDGSDPVRNFQELIDLDKEDFLQTLRTECNHFKTYVDKK